MKRSLAARGLLLLAFVLLGGLLQTPNAEALSFSAHLDAVSEESPAAVAVGDLNEDGKKDVVVLGFVYHASVFLGDGTGAFGAWTNFAVAGSPGGIALGDLNADGHQDLVTTLRYGTYVTFWEGDGGGWFESRSDWSSNDGLSDNPSSVVIGDFDGDGKQDVVPANAGSATISLLARPVPGAWVRTVFAVGATPEAVAVADFNRDGKKDVATANAGADTVSVLLGDGSGGLGAKADFAVGYEPCSIAVGDFRRDGKPDPVTANHAGASISVLRNTTALKLRSLTPTRGRVGATVTIAGWGFGPRRGTSKVFFVSRAVTRYVSWSAGKIKVKVPGVAAGAKMVRVKTAVGVGNGLAFRVL